MVPAMVLRGKRESTLEELNKARPRTGLRWGRRLRAVLANSCHLRARWLSGLGSYVGRVFSVVQELRGAGFCLSTRGARSYLSGIPLIARPRRIASMRESACAA